MRKSWKSVASSLAAYMALDDILRALNAERKLLADDGKRMTAEERAGTLHTIAFLEECVENWGNE